MAASEVVADLNNIAEQVRVVMALLSGASYRVCSTENTASTTVLPMAALVRAEREKLQPTKGK